MGILWAIIIALLATPITYTPVTIDELIFAAKVNESCRMVASDIAVQDSADIDATCADLSAELGAAAARDGVASMTPAGFTQHQAALMFGCVGYAYKVSGFMPANIDSRCGMFFAEQNWKLTQDVINIRDGEYTQL